MFAGYGTLVVCTAKAWDSPRAGTVPFLLPFPLKLVPFPCIARIFELFRAFLCALRPDLPQQNIPSMQRYCRTRQNHDYLIISAIMSAVIYPVFGHRAWGMRAVGFFILPEFLGGLPRWDQIEILLIGIVACFRNSHLDVPSSRKTAMLAY